MPREVATNPSRDPRGQASNAPWRLAADATGRTARYLGCPRPGAAGNARRPCRMLPGNTLAFGRVGADKFLVDVAAPAGPGGNTNSPFSMTGGWVTISSFQLTSSMSISMTLKFGATAHIWALINEPRWPLKLCGAILTS